MRYIKVFFKFIKWDNDNGSGSCYVYTSTPGYRASASMNGAVASFGVSVRSKDSKSQSVEESVTLWLSDSDGNSLTKDEASLYRDVFGSSCYLQVDADNQMQLLSSNDFAALPADDQSNLVSSLHLS